MTIRNRWVGIGGQQINQ